MSQPYESIGTPSPELEAVAARHEGFDTDVPEELGAQLTDPTLSFYSDRANMQVLFKDTPTMAGHREISMAERSVQPF